MALSRATGGWLRRRLAGALWQTWWSPRYIGTVYMLDGLRQALPWARGLMLDIGCGHRVYEPLFSGRVSRYIGLDWPTSPDHARPDVFGDALQLPLAAGSVDTVLATEVMEHLPDPDRFLAQISAVLRPGGCLILSTPFLEPIHEAPRDYFRFTPHGLRVLLERHGFRVRRVWQKGGWWSVVVGSFVNQVLYETANPVAVDGGRRYNVVRTAVALPLCALAQFVGYSLDRLVRSDKYSLGYLVVATRGA